MLVHRLQVGNPEFLVPLWHEAAKAGNVGAVDDAHAAHFNVRVQSVESRPVLYLDARLANLDLQDEVLLGPRLNLLTLVTDNDLMHIGPGLNLFLLRLLEHLPQFGPIPPPQAKSGGVLFNIISFHSN